MSVIIIFLNIESLILRLVSVLVGCEGQGWGSRLHEEVSNTYTFILGYNGILFHIYKKKK